MRVAVSINSLSPVHMHRVHLAMSKKTINTASYAAGPLMRLSTVSDTSTKAMCRDLSDMVAILSRKLFHLDQPSSNTKKALTATG